MLNKLPTVADRIEEEACSFLERNNKAPTRVVLGEITYIALLKEVVPSIYDKDFKDHKPTYMSSAGPLDVLVSVEAMLIQVS